MLTARPHCCIAVHDEVVTWKHFLHYWPFVRRIHQSLLDSTSLLDSPSIRWMMWSFDAFLCYMPERTVEHTVELPLIWNIMMLMWHHFNDFTILSSVGVFIVHCQWWGGGIGMFLFVHLSVCLSINLPYLGLKPFPGKRFENIDFILIVYCILRSTWTFLP